MTTQAIHEGKIFDVVPFLAAQVLNGTDVAALWRRGRWMVVNRAVSHCADLPLGQPLIGAPADLNAKPWRVRPWSVLDELERLDVLRTVTVCECVRHGHATVTAHCAVCAGQVQPAAIALETGSLLEWREGGRIDARFRANVVGRGPLLAVRLQRVSAPGLFDQRDTPIASPRFGVAVFDVQGAPWTFSRRVGGELTTRPLRPAASVTFSSAPRRERRRPDGY